MIIKVLKGQIPGKRVRIRLAAGSSAGTSLSRHAWVELATVLNKKGNLTNENASFRQANLLKMKEMHGNFQKQ